MQDCASRSARSLRERTRLSAEVWFAIPAVESGTESTQGRGKIRSKGPRAVASVWRMEIRAFEERDWPQVWPIVEQIVRKGDTFCYDPLQTEAQAHDMWVVPHPGPVSSALDARSPYTHVVTAAFAPCVRRR